MKEHKTTLVLEGGAMRGLYSAAVLDVFMENNINIDAVYGVSAGALFGLNYKSRQKGRALRYNLKYAHEKNYMGLYSLITTGNIMNKDFCFKKLVYELDKLDFETYKNNPVEFYAVVTNLKTGKPKKKKTLDYSETFGNKLIKLRKNNKISQEKLADILGVTRQTISNWELNVTKPDINQIKKISKIFNKSIDELLDNDIRDIIERKVSNTEKMTNKATKNVRIIIITLYFIILSLIISFIVYCLINNDFTDEYQMEITCTLNDSELYLELNSLLDDDEIITDYTLEIKKMEDGHTSLLEIYDAGDSVGEAFDSIKVVKEILINQGAICK